MCGYPINSALHVRFEIINRVIEIFFHFKHAFSTSKFGFLFGSYHWAVSAHTGVVSSAGSVMIAGMSLIMGVQFVLAFLAYDISSVPRRPIHAIRISK